MKFLAAPPQRIRRLTLLVQFGNHQALSTNQKVNKVQSDMPTFSRNVNVEMEWLDGSSFEICGSLNDNVHSVAARLVLGYPDFSIRQATGEITRMPYPGFCQGATVALEALVGERIGRGFRKRASDLLGGAASCNHLHTLITSMAACAFQMNYMAAKQRPEAAAMMQRVEDNPRLKRDMVLHWMPQLRNSCFLFSEANDRLFNISRREDTDGSLQTNSESGES
jgi:hypothetical protein